MLLHFVLLLPPAEQGSIPKTPLLPYSEAQCQGGGPAWVNAQLGSGSWEWLSILGALSGLIDLGHPSLFWRWGEWELYMEDSGLEHP